MAETKTPYLKLIQPEVGGSYDVWGNRLNSDLSTIDSHTLNSDSWLYSGLQNGGNHTTQMPNPADATKILFADDKAFRIAQELLFYSDSANPKQILNDDKFGGYRKDGLLISQGFLWDFLEKMFPIGVIVPWSPITDTGGNIINYWDPAIWHVADGTPVTIIEPAGPRSVTLPNLVNRFVRGSNTSATPATGGTTQHIHDFTSAGLSLATNQIPRMQVQNDPAQGTGSGSLVVRCVGGSATATYDLPTKSSGATGDATSGVGVTISGNAAAGGAADAHAHSGNTGQQRPLSLDGSQWLPPGNELLPPYISLAYLIKIGRFRKIGDPVV